MGGIFLTPLRAEKIKEAGNSGRAKWRLLAPLSFCSALTNEVYTAEAGFVTDFASVPRIPFAYLLAGDTAHASAVIHDYLARYVYIANEISWNIAADVFGEAMKLENVPAWRRVIMVNAVKLAGVFK